MIARICRQYPVKLMLDLLLKVSKSKASWWLLDSEETVLYANTSTAFTKGNIHWEIVVGEHYGTLVSSQKTDVLLSEIIQQLIVLLIQTELQRQADIHWRENLQEMLNLHTRYRQLLGVIRSRQEISRLVVNESLKITAATSAVLYSHTHTGLYVLDAYLGKSPYGTQPPFRLPEGLLTTAIQQQERQWVNNIRSYYGSTIAEAKAKNALIFPLQSIDELWGVLAMFDQPDDFRAVQVQKVQILADYAAIAYHNAAAVQQLTQEHHMPRQDTEAEWDDVFEHSDLDWREAAEPINPKPTTKSHRIDNR